MSQTDFVFLLLFSLSSLSIYLFLPTLFAFYFFFHPCSFSLCWFVSFVSGCSCLLLLFAWLFSLFLFSVLLSYSVCNVSVCVFLSLFVQVPPQMGQMGGVPVMAPQPMMYNQPVLRPTNPFAPMPGAQVSYPVFVHSYALNNTFATDELYVENVIKHVNVVCFWVM